MTRRDMAVQGTLAFGLIVGIVGGNFVLHRWVLGNAASREADAGTVSTSTTPDDLDEFAPQRYRGSTATAPNDPTVHRKQLRLLIAQKLPQASEEDREAWLDELSDVSLNAAAGILDLRDQVGGAKGLVKSLDRIPNQHPSFRIAQ